MGTQPEVPDNHTWMDGCLMGIGHLQGIMDQPGFHGGLDKKPILSPSGYPATLSPVTISTTLSCLTSRDQLCSVTCSSWNIFQSSGLWPCAVLSVPGTYFSTIHWSTSHLPSRFQPSLTTPHKHTPQLGDMSFLCAPRLLCSDIAYCLPLAQELRDIATPSYSLAP